MLPMQRSVFPRIQFYDAETLRFKIFSLAFFPLFMFPSKWIRTYVTLRASTCVAKPQLYRLKYPISQMMLTTILPTAPLTFFKYKYHILFLVLFFSLDIVGRGFS